jgi:hypothetical protein
MNHTEEAYWDREISNSALDELADNGQLFLDDPVVACAEIHGDATEEIHPVCQRNFYLSSQRLFYMARV